MTRAHFELWPRVPEYRYRLYGRLGRRELTVLATAPDMAGIGAAIGQLHEDAKEAGGAGIGDHGQLGILDVLPSGVSARGEWIVLPWNRPDPPRGARW